MSVVVSLLFFAVVHYWYCVRCEDTDWIFIMSATPLSFYAAQFKLSVMKLTKGNGNRAASRKFDVVESKVLEWKKPKGKIKCYYS